MGTAFVCFSLFFVCFCFWLRVCARFSWPYSAFQCTLKSRIFSYRISKKRTKVKSRDILFVSMRRVGLSFSWFIDVYFSPLGQNTNAKCKYKYKYRIKTSKNNKKKKPTVPDRRTDKTREYECKYTKSSKLHIIRTNDQSIKVNVNKLLHSTYGVIVTKFDL